MNSEPSKPDKPHAQAREMTYRVGRKTGKIVRKENGGNQAVRASYGKQASSHSRLTDSLLLLWREASYPTERVIVFMLWLLPGALFALFVWLVYRLGEYQH